MMTTRLETPETCPPEDTCPENILVTPHDEDPSRRSTKEITQSLRLNQEADMSPNLKHRRQDFGEMSEKPRPL